MNEQVETDQRTKNQRLIAAALIIGVAVFTTGLLLVVRDDDSDEIAATADTSQDVSETTLTELQEFGALDIEGSVTTLSPLAETTTTSTEDGTSSTSTEGSATTTDSTTGTTARPTSNSGKLVPIPARGAYLGMNSGDSANGISVASQEALLGQKMSLERIFYPDREWTENINIKRVQAAHDQGRIPMVSFKVGPWKDVTAGKSDAIIDSLARQIKASEIPMLLTFHHEPEDNACNNSNPGCGRGQTAADFVSMWRYIHNRFDRIGVDNVSWNWTIMGWQFTDVAPDDERERVISMYPGDQYVDWISGDIYNFAGNCSVTPAEINDRWSPLKDRGQAFYDWASKKGKPLALGEWGVFHDSLEPGRKAEWFRDARQTLKSWTNIKAVAYFDRNHEGCDWRLTTGGNAGVNAYKELAADPYFIKG